jgi:hypothetical protein
VIDSLRPLTQEQRQEARQAAQNAVFRAMGARPSREQFTHHATSTYPPSVTRLISGLCIVLLLAAFTPSAIRLYVIGSHTFGQAVSNSAAKTAVGLATVLSAEVGQVVFSLALATLGTSGSARRLLYGSMGIATIIALTGNVQLALPGHEKSPFAWLEAVAPPLLVLSTAYVIKEQLLDAIQQRHANERAFQEALHDWQQATSNPESHSHWSQFYANALRDALRKMNARRQDALQDMTIADWRAAIYRELQAEEWYATPKPDNEKPSEQKTEIQPEAEPVPLALNASGNGHGHANGNGSTGKGGV